MRSPGLDPRAVPALVALAVLTVHVTGCASASATSQPRVEARTLNRPPVVLVHRFAVDSEDVMIDTMGIGSTATTSKKVSEARKIAGLFAEKLVNKMRAQGIPAERAGHDGIPPLDALVVKGQFITIDEGSRVARMIIGFGLGAQELRARAQVYQVSQGGLLRVDQGRGEARGDSMPGMAVPVGVGAAAGRVATTAVISGGMNVVSEIRGTMDVRLDHLADEFTDRAVDFYVRQGWL